MNSWGLPTPVAILLGLCVGLAVGLLNGFIVNRFGLPAFIATMGTQYIARGFCNVVTQGESITGFPSDFNAVGSFGFFRIPWSVYVALILAILVYLVFKYTTFGRSLLAVGGNRETARVCGIPVKRVCNGSFIISGVFAALAGILSTARLGTAQASAGTGWEMTCIAAAIIGGVSMFGRLCDHLRRFHRRVSDGDAHGFHDHAARQRVLAARGHRHRHHLRRGH